MSEYDPACNTTIPARRLHEIIAETDPDTHVRASRFYREITALLPQPKTMAEIPWSDDDHFLREAIRHDNRGRHVVTMVVAEYAHGEQTGMIYCRDADGYLNIEIAEHLIPTENQRQMT